MPQMTVNGVAVRIDGDPRELLSDALRRQGLHSVHVGCEEGACGGCTILVDGAPARSCLTLAASAEGRSVTTLEGVDPDLRQRMQASFSRNSALQCGFCSPGFMMLLAFAAAQDGAPVPADALVDANLCRCTGYEGIRRAFAEVLVGNRPSGTTEPVG